MEDELYESDNSISNIEGEELKKKEEELKKLKIDLNNKEASKKKKMVKKDPKNKIKTVRVVVGEKEYDIPEKAIYDLSKREYKIKEDKKKIKEGEVCILYLRESGIAEIKYVRPDNGMFIVDGVYYHIKESCNYSLGNKRIPLAVIPEWAFIPLSRKDYSQKLASNTQEAQKLIIKTLESAEIVKINKENEPAKKADTKLVIYIVIAAVAGLYFLNKMTGSG